MKSQSFVVLMVTIVFLSDNQRPPRSSSAAVPSLFSVAATRVGVSVVPHIRNNLNLTTTLSRAFQRPLPTR